MLTGKIQRLGVTFLGTSALIIMAALGSSDLFVPPVQGQAGTPIGPPLPGVTAFEKNLYSQGIFPFDLEWTINSGLGPDFTRRACTECHIKPTGGGGSDTILNTLFGKLNSDGSFNPLINEGGPQVQGTSINSLSGFPPKSTCKVAPETLPADATIVDHRLPPQTFGDGLIDAIADSTLLNEVTTQQNDPTYQQLGIHGAVNLVTDLNTGTLRPGRFGRKSQEPTLLQFVADAELNELGITTPIFQQKLLPNGQPIPQACLALELDVPVNDPVPNTNTPFPKVLQMFQTEVFLAPLSPLPSFSSPAAQAGLQVFQNIGCAKCHIPSLQTASQVFVPTLMDTNGHVTKTEGPSKALSNQTLNLYSDMLIHDMGAGLAGIPQGQATFTQWRTTPLWGLGRRVNYLHDGRTADLPTAILAHAGEATIVIQNFQQLSSTDQQNLLAFLNSL